MLDYPSVFLHRLGRREPTIPMKPTTPSFRLLPTLVVAIITAWFAHPAWAVSVEPTLTLTEVSNTQLTWAWDLAGGGTSGTITTLTPDNWGFTSISGPNLIDLPGTQYKLTPVGQSRRVDLTTMFSLATSKGALPPLLGQSRALIPI
jgi:hypothetical protein